MNPDHLVGAALALGSAAFLIAHYAPRVLAWWEQRRLCGTDCARCPDPLDVAQRFHDDLDDFARWTAELEESA